MLRQRFDSFFVRADHLYTRARCGCEAQVRVEWVEEFAKKEKIDLKKEKFARWKPEVKKKFVEAIAQKLSRAYLSYICSLHRPS